MGHQHGGARHDRLAAAGDLVSWHPPRASLCRSLPLAPPRVCVRAIYLEVDLSLCARACGYADAGHNAHGGLSAHALRAASHQHAPSLQ